MPSRTRSRTWFGVSFERQLPHVHAWRERDLAAVDVLLQDLHDLREDLMAREAFALAAFAASAPGPVAPATRSSTMS